MNKDYELAEAELDVLMEQLTIEKAPTSLTHRLKRIPREERGRAGLWSRLFPEPFPRWAMAPAFAAVPLIVLAVVLMQPRQPSAADVEQARHDVAVAFAYMDKVGFRASSEIKTVLGNELRRGVKEPLSEHIPFTEQSLKEETT